MLINHANFVAKYYGCSIQDAVAVSFRCKKFETPFALIKTKLTDSVCHSSSNGFDFFAFRRKDNRYEYYKVFNPEITRLDFSKIVPLGEILYDKQ